MSIQLVYFWFAVNAVLEKKGGGEGGYVSMKASPMLFSPFSNAAPDILSYIPASFKDMFLNPIQNADSH